MERKKAPELPSDVLTEILSRVPAESLVRFKCVCKSWYRLISDEDFVRLHLEHWRSAGHVLISGDTRDLTFTKRKIYRLTLNLEAQSHCDEICIDDFLVHALPLPELPEPVQTDDDVRFMFLDSCDGLLLLAIIDRRSAARALHLLVCNPITKWYMLLPPCPSFTTTITNSHWVIARDHPVQRYRIIGIQSYRFPDGPPSVRCFIFELRRGEGRGSVFWKELQAHIPWNGDLLVLPPSLSIGRKVHWLMRLDRVGTPVEIVLLSLDLSTERFKPTKTPNLPYYPGHNWFFSNRAMCFGRRIQSSKEIEVWILEDFDRPVWRKHHVVSNYPHGLEFPSKHYDLRPMLYMKEEDELIMRMGLHTFVYKMSSREWRRFIVRPAKGDFTSWLDHSHRRHVNSLV